MKQLFAIIAFLFSISAAQAIDWQEVDVPKSEYIYYVTQKGDDIIICGAGVKVSHDGGETFEYSNNINNMVFDGDTIRTNGLLNTACYISNAGNYFTIPKRGFVLYSTNKGDSWEVSNISSDIDYPEFFEDENGICLAHEQGLYFSIDQGVTWTEVLKYEYYDDTYSTYCLLNNKVYLFDQSYYDGSQVVHIFDTDLQTIDSLTSDRNIDHAYVYDNLLYDYTYSNYPDDYDTLFKSTNGGANWEFELDFRDKIKDQIKPDAENITIRDIDAENGKIWIRYMIKENDTTELTYYAFSPDNGTTFTEVNYSEEDFPLGFYTTFLDGKIYALGHSLMIFDEASTSFKPLDYDFPVTYMYRKFDDLEIAWSLVDGDGNLLSWEKNAENWERKSYLGRGGYMTMQGAELSKGSSTNDQTMGLRITYKDVLDTVFSNYKYWDQNRLLEDGSTAVILRNEDTYYNKIIKINNGVVTEIKSDVDGEIDYCLADNSYMYITENDDIYYLCKGYTNTSEEDSLEINVGDGYLSIREFSAQKNKIIFSTYDSLYISNNGGQTIQAFDNSKYFSRKSEIFVRGKYFYFRNAFGLFRSLDGNTWENLFEEDNMIVKYEFDLEGYIYAYTTMGTFKSEAPVSVQEDENKTKTPNISIYIYPNPSSDVLNFDFNGQVDKAAVVDLNGNVISCPQTLNSLDISELSSGAYFLKITSNGKTYYRQFVKAE